LDRSGRGTISEADLTMIPEVVMNPLAKRLCAMFERDDTDRINFRNFARGLSVLSERASPSVKIEALFRLYDVDGDGFITESDIRAVMALATGSAMEEAEVAKVAKQTIAAADKDGDGKISLWDFTNTRIAPWEGFSVPVSRAARDKYFLLSQLEEERKVHSTPF
jgi:serine/threonine-protein phosphatase 2B regulatory subunit